MQAYKSLQRGRIKNVIDPHFQHEEHSRALWMSDSLLMWGA